MAIQLRVAASLDILSEELIVDLKNEKTGVFDKQWVVTQTDGINNWLRHQLALQAGIAANLEFTKVNDILKLLYYWLCPDAPVLMDKDRITWALFASLNEDEFKTKFPEIAIYYKENETRRALLATEMADLFDQYQIYRQDKIISWNKNEIQEEDDLNWQGFLWSKLKERLGKEYYDRVDVSTRILNQLKEEESRKKVQLKLPCLRFFGLAIVTPYYLELFNVLSEIIDIKFYLLNPSPDQLWMDDLSDKKIAALRNRPDLLELRSTGNELLINWGSILRESYQILLSEDDYVNRYEVVDTPLFLNDPTSLLSCIQSEIYNNIPNASRKPIDDKMLNDGSLQINGCYTPVREIEVLYNYLVEVFASNTSIGARDIVVMTTDIDTYAPYIKAIFDNAPVSIPYTIADESVSKGNTLFTAIRDILSVDTQTFKAEEVLALLDSSYIRRRFNFNDIAIVRQAVREAGIYFGTGTNDDASELYDQTEAWMVSWKYGLEKMMYGLCMSSDEEFAGANKPLIPLDTAEGAGMYDRVRLYHFIQVLKNLLDERLERKTLKQWSEYLGKIMTEMILEEDDEDEDFPRFAHLKDSIMQLDEAAAGESISYQTFRQVFFDKLEQERRTNRYAGRGVNFCSMLPMRSVPFKVVAILGMDFDKYPRQDSALSFNLIGKEKRPGDRSVRENDKHLFLESILAAREKLYISYIARDAEKGTDQPPSTLVDELLDYIALKTADVAGFKKSKICIHPLHLFSTKYCEPDSKLAPNYLGNSLIQGNQFQNDPNRKDDTSDFSIIPLEQFAHFFNNPIKYYFNKKLGIYYRENDERISDAELFELDNSQKWQVKNDLIQSDLDPDNYIKQEKQSGKLPLANMGKVLVHDLYNSIQEFSEVLKNLTQGKVQSQLDINYTFDNSKIQGTLPVYDNNYIYYTVSTSKLKHYIYPWVSYLVAIAQDSAPKLDFTILFNHKEDKGKKKEKITPFNIFYSEDLCNFAKSILPDLLKLFKQGHDRIVLFYPPLAPLCYVLDPPQFESQALIDIYEEELEKEQGILYFNKDNYLKQVIEANDFSYEIFNDDNTAEFTRNTLLLTQELKSRLPKLFLTK
jgi:exodeoxyribonuclease V gamma subunit